MLNLSSLQEDRAWEAALEKVETHCGVPICWKDQVHGSRVLEARHPGLIGETDALYTSQPELGLLVRHADCLPLLLYERRLPAVGAIHAGWRGLLQGIIPAFFAQLKGFWDPQQTTVAIGPSLGPQSAEFLHYRTEWPEALWHYRCDDPRINGPSPRFNLWALAHDQLAAAGVPPDAIECIGMDTFADSRFFSHRQRHIRGVGNNGSVIWLKRRS